MVVDTSFPNADSIIMISERFKGLPSGKRRSIFLTVLKFIQKTLDRVEFLRRQLKIRSPNRNFVMTVQKSMKNIFGDL